MAGEMAANRRYNNGDTGFYVVNPETQIAVAGPFRAATPAHLEAASRNTTPPLAPTQLEVVEIAYSRSR